MSIGSYPVLSARKARRVPPEVIDAEIVYDAPVLPVIQVVTECQVVDQVVELLVSGCDDIFQRDAQLVRIVRTASTGPYRPPQIVEVSSIWLRDKISKLARFKTLSRGRYRDSLVPDWLAPMVLARRCYPGLRMLEAISETPVFLADGRVLEDGYDGTRGVLVLPRGPGEPVAATPTLEDAVAAKTCLLDVVGDFPFSQVPSPEAHHAALLAWLLTLVARYAIQGPTPFLVLDASSQASGKGLLIDICHMIATSRPVTCTAYSGDGDELRRAIWSILRGGRRVGWFDEVGSPFGGRAWNALMTAWPTYSDRTVRTSDSSALPALTCWIASANNLMLGADTARRAMMVRLEPCHDRPEDRTDFRHPDLRDYVSREQPRLLAAALTILRAFHAAGRPRVLTTAVGSFNAWDDLVRQAVAWVTGQDPIAPRREAESLIDQRRYAWRDIAQALWVAFESRPFTAKHAAEALAGPTTTEAAQAAVQELMAGSARPATVVSFAKAVLHPHRGTFAGDLVLEVVKPHSNRGTIYRMKRV